MSMTQVQHPDGRAGDALAARAKGRSRSTRSIGSPVAGGRWRTRRRWRAWSRRTSASSSASRWSSATRARRWRTSIQEGNLGLTIAARRFDPGAGDAAGDLRHLLDSRLHARACRALARAGAHRHHALAAQDLLRPRPRAPQAGARGRGGRRRVAGRRAGRRARGRRGDDAAADRARPVARRAALARRSARRRRRSSAEDAPTPEDMVAGAGRGRRAARSACPRGSRCSTRASAPSSARVTCGRGRRRWRRWARSSASAASACVSSSCAPSRSCASSAACTTTRRCWRSSGATTGTLRIGRRPIIAVASSRDEVASAPETEEATEPNRPPLFVPPALRD